eukprot:CAMPEP_0204058164 /NCGR_PEP_ID=MMETSP0360-20130528/135458_1 /ASSEMBLY_ACC=CAM_ASM_000342 /TAXON_ID=268821 /ORGANISM="Scrippsiella Hangoei, Strain SHTV-5" /LENGTH=32 /DNA_ID= /DNA_START= /DNA_END= /DNA_ORIENTATION=
MAPNLRVPKVDSLHGPRSMVLRVNLCITVIKA